MKEMVPLVLSRCSRCYNRKSPEKFIGLDGQPRKLCSDCLDSRRKAYAANPEAHKGDPEKQRVRGLKARAENPEKFRERRRKQYVKTREQSKEYSREYHKKNRAKCIADCRKGDLRRKYGLTIEDHAAMVEAQKRRCAICGVETEKLCVDHNHDINEPRALLCHLCNRALGMFKEDKLVLQRAIEYLTFWEEKTREEGL